MIASAIFTIVALAAFAILVSPWVRSSKEWQATVTPLASIIGSGFLVSAPLLGAALGRFSIAAMAALIAAAYLIGSAVRFNIAHAEPVLRDDPPRLLWWIEQLSHLALALAYFISVAYYLTLLASFALKELGLSDETLARGIATAILLAIGSIGLWRGLKEIEQIEIFSVSANLAVIAGLMAALLWFNGALMAKDGWAWTAEAGPLDMHTVLTVLGLLIVVQGFETSRFLGDEFDGDLRIRSMRLAQLGAAAIYLVFFMLVTVLFDRTGELSGDVAAIIDMVRPVAIIIPTALTLGAVASQFSASVADSIGAAGLVEELSGNRIPLKLAYPLVAGAAIAITWSSDVFEIITYASRAFAIFYAIQCAVAVMVAWRAPDLAHRKVALVAYSSAGMIALAVAIFALPSSA